ncbi:hypothetical protein OC188_03910 [Anaplasma capra]|uniref:hypothetical protein n=1 Tax=Anaplasma capra TaxID=1562740 RepID=UPI0021D580E3|nr:hypothetical protein [Anaplasma capra]MCU7611832.1 hypothetical protein [Anaplasma capra]
MEAEVAASASGGPANALFNCLPDTSACDEEKAYDLRSRVYTAYMLCSSILCVLPLIPYYISKELYKRGKIAGAAASMELFLCLHSSLTRGLICIKLLLVIFRKYPHLLADFFIPHSDLAILFLAAMCTIPLSIITMTWRYYSVYVMVMETKCSICHALLEQSYLRDILYGMPALVSYSGYSGPFFTSENVKRAKVYDGDVAYEVYLYCTSYLLILPACLALLCNYLYRERKKTAMSVVRVLSALSHVLLVNTFLIATIAYFALLRFERVLLFAGLRSDPVSVAALVGVLSSVAVLIVATAFCCYSAYGESAVNPEVPDNVARSALKFGILTAAVCNVCALFVAREKFKDRRIPYSGGKFAYDIFFCVTASLLMLPACFSQLSSELYALGHRKLSAIAGRTCLLLEILFTNTLVLGSLLTWMLYMPYFGGIAHDPAGVGFLAALAVSGTVLAAAVVYDSLYVVRALKKRATNWEDTILYDKCAKRNVANFGLLNLVARGVIFMILLILGKRENRESSRFSASANSEFGVSSTAPVHDPATDAVCCY